MVYAVTILCSLIMLKVGGRYPRDFSLKGESHRSSLTSWNQPSSNPEIDLHADSHSQVKLI